MNVRLGFPQGGTARPMQRPPHRCAGESNYPIHLVESLTLRDGAALTIRPICSDDYQLELDFIRALSARSGYQRLLSPRKLSIAEIQRFVRIDYSRELALIALAVVDGKVQQVAVARYAPEPDDSSCDFGIVIADAWQGRGLGEALLRSLVRAAAEAGVQELTGLTLADNHAMRELAGRLGFSIQRDPHDATVVQLRMPLRNHSRSSTPFGGRPAGTGMLNAPAFTLEHDDLQVGSWAETGISPH